MVMAYVRSELRAFPRLACGRPGSMELAGVVEDCQVVDLSQGGCKVMPMALTHLAGLDLRPGTEIRLSVGGHQLAARLAWSTPNMSALGCAFLEPLVPAVLDALVAVAAAAE